MTHRPYSRSKRTTWHRRVLLLAALVMMAAALVNQVRIKACVGDCCEVAKVAVCHADAKPTDGCCCCCQHASRRTGEQAHGGCDPGCCVTFDYAIELAPVELAALPDLPLPPTFAVVELPRFVDAPPKPRIRRRFDRGPPRTDRRTELRACTVLLI